MDLQLAGRKAIVTGSSRGIGLAIASELAREGAAVAICGRNATEVDAAVASIVSAGGTAFGSVVDVADAEGYRSWLDDATARLGGLDVFVANASAMVTDDSESSWQQAFSVDLLHTVRGCEAVKGSLIASDSGAVVITATVSASVGRQPASERAYASIKAALVSYGSQLADQLAPDGVRVNMISPGMILFPGGFWDSVRTGAAEFFDGLSATIALGRMGTAQEVARAAAFLASPAASYITGANLRVDGGLSAATNF
jgi:3-oxoacyl-[acyl-carrier protein] reductase